MGLELALHFIYAQGINERIMLKFSSNNSVDPELWQNLPTSLEVGMTGYFTLNFMYMKFLVVWRMFRVFALIDGIDCPEDMPRCVNNNYSFTGFWRLLNNSNFNNFTEHGTVRLTSSLFAIYMFLLEDPNTNTLQFFNF